MQARPAPQRHHHRAACLSAFAHAQSFPNGPINIVVPLAPGDAADTTVRLLGEEIAKALNTAVSVTNRPGAGGAWRRRAWAARKDGQTSCSRRTARSPSAP
jgi:tripartite-type tricarboxylate transporter receptor subunit TctC